jgi:hypothetical protein
MDTIEVGNEIQGFIPIRFSETEFSQFFRPLRVFFKVSGANSMWTIPFKPDQSLVNGSIFLTVPALVNAGPVKVTMSAELGCIFPGYDSIRVFTDTVSAILDIRPALKCNAMIKGSNGLTILKMDMEENPGLVKVRFQPFGVPDRFQIRQGSEYILSSCPSMPDGASLPRCEEEFCFIRKDNNGWYEYSFNYNPSKGRFIEILVLGWCSEQITTWNMEVSCPQQ